MASKPPPSPERLGPADKPGAKASLVLLLGTALAGLLIGDIRTDEGRVYHAYRDLGGVVSICEGDTKNVKLGDVATDAQCDERTAAALLVHAKIVIGCVPGLRAVGRENQLRAATRFDYNLGKFCSSSGARLMKAEKWRAGCDALLAYNGIITVGHPIKGALSVRRLAPDAKGRARFFNVIRGLNNRRAHEHEVCVRGLAA